MTDQSNILPLPLMTRRVLTCKRSALAGDNGNDGWLDVFHQCGTVGRADGEDRDQFQKFKYACGRNWDRVMSAIKTAQEEVKAILSPSDDFHAWMRICEDLNREYCTKDTSGNPVLKVNENGSQSFTFTPENRRKRDALMDGYRSDPKWAAVLQEDDDKRSQANAFMEGTIDMELYTVPWDFLPERMSAPYMARVAIMCTGAPADIEADLAKILAGS